MTDDDARREQDAALADRLPLSALLSRALVAYTIELDNEFEHLMPHRTADYGATPAAPYTPWLTSAAMWFTCLRFVNERGITVRELERVARTRTNLDGMRRWGYITISPDTTGAASKQPRPDAMLRATPAGLRAREVWQPLFGVIEQHWHERLGGEAVNELRHALWAVANQFDAELPDYLPIVRFGLVTSVLDGEPRTPVAGDVDPAITLAALLSKVLLRFTLAFERVSPVSLPICANVLRLAREDDVRVRDLPRRSGVSKVAIAMALTFLQGQGYATVEADSTGSRTKVLHLTPRGRRVESTYYPLAREIEGRWQSRFGAQSVVRLRAALECVSGSSDADSPLMHGLEPYPDGWRAKIPRSEVLPHYPTVLHRGGFPDGS
jgi:DNA-binding MarR family transcriptional regulator